jgi:hypothetical protein
VQNSVDIAKTIGPNISKSVKVIQPSKKSRITSILFLRKLSLNAAFMMK